MLRIMYLMMLLVVTVSFASPVDIFFTSQKSGEFCGSLIPYSLKKFNSQVQLCKEDNSVHHVRIRVEKPISDKNAGYGISIERPFFILDGIYLNTDGLRTLSGFEEEVNQLGFIDVLEELGYTPVLVQFHETVKTSLEKNAGYFAQLLKFLNSNNLIGFPNKMESGMVVMGISQGGILGRYGAYLYDSQRNKKTDAPIRLYASLDSPHQGAILPLSLYHTLEFWARFGGSSDAEAFRDLINGPGASELLLYKKKFLLSFLPNSYDVSTSPSRFLFGDYRKAAEYNGFPAVLVAQGQLKGAVPKHNEKYFDLNRKAQKIGLLMGRIESEMCSYDDGKKRISKNRIYQKLGSDNAIEIADPAKFDFVQGSTYPFAETMYNSLHFGFESAMPSGMSSSVFGMSTSISTAWDEDTLYQKNSTFIPTVSAMDMKCSGDLAIKSDCAFKQSSSGFPFANPGSLSSGDASYAVDPTHPRYKEPISGRHVELPTQSDGDNSNVVKGFQVDMWRILCELANYDYDAEKKGFRNENLEWYFTPGTNCMDQSKIPEVIKAGGIVLKKKFGYGRYDYASKATEKNSSVQFDLPAGWHKVALFDNGRDIEAGSFFEVEVTVNSSKGNWMKAELLLSRLKNGSGQIQLSEIRIPVAGDKFIARWKLPSSQEALSHYRWFRLILNSDGANVTLSNPRLYKTNLPEAAPKKKLSNNVFPNQSYHYYAWPSQDEMSSYADALGKGILLQTSGIGHGMHFDFNGMKSLEGYSVLEINYWPGTCQRTAIYFDSYRNSNVRLNRGAVSGNLVKAEIPISDIIDTRLTPNGMLSASRLVLQATAVNETCIIKSINLR